MGESRGKATEWENRGERRQREGTSPEEWRTERIAERGEGVEARENRGESAKRGGTGNDRERKRKWKGDASGERCLRARRDGGKWRRGWRRWLRGWPGRVNGGGWRKGRKDVAERRTTPVMDRRTVGGTGPGEGVVDETAAERGRVKNNRG